MATKVWMPGERLKSCGAPDSNSKQDISTKRVACARSAAPEEDHKRSTYLGEGGKVADGGLRTSDRGITVGVDDEGDLLGPSAGGDGEGERALLRGELGGAGGASAASELAALDHMGQFEEIGSESATPNSRKTFYYESKRGQNNINIAKSNEI